MDSAIQLTSRGLDPLLQRDYRGSPNPWSVHDDHPYPISSTQWIWYQLTDWLCELIVVIRENQGTRDIP